MTTLYQVSTSSRKCLFCGFALVALFALLPSCASETTYKRLPQEQRVIPEGTEILDTYTHLSCGTQTRMSRDIAETLYVKPDFYSPWTYCVHHRSHFHESEFKWTKTNENMFEWRLRRLTAIQLAKSPEAAQPGTVRRYDAGDHGFLLVVVPPGWGEEIRPSQNPLLPPEIAYRPESGPPFVVLISVFRPMGSPKPLLEVARESVDGRVVEIKPNAEEADIEVKALRGPQASGYNFSATDRAPKQGEYRYLTQGALTTDGLVVTFTILTNDGQRSVIERALVMVRNLARQP